MARQRLNREVTEAWFQIMARKSCLYPGCGTSPVELHHFQLFRSSKTGLMLPRKIGLNEIAVIPLCHKHHRTGREAAHRFRESDFLGMLDLYWMAQSGETVRDKFLFWLAEVAFEGLSLPELLGKE